VPLAYVPAGARLSLRTLIARACGLDWRRLVADFALRADLNPRAFRTGLELGRTPW